MLWKLFGGRRFTSVAITMVSAHEARQLIERRGALVVDLRHQPLEFRRIEEALRTTPVIFVDTSWEDAMHAVGKAGFRRGDIFVANARDLP